MDAESGRGVEAGEDRQSGEIDNLREELDHFVQEKEKIRQVVGSIGGKQSDKRDAVITIVFIVAIILLFLLDVLRHLLHFEIPLPPLVSLELGVLLVSMKIIWMMYKQAKVEHFQFWILNSLEFRLNDISQRIRKIEKAVGVKKQKRGKMAPPTNRKVEGELDE